MVSIQVRSLTQVIAHYLLIALFALLFIDLATDIGSTVPMLVLSGVTAGVFLLAAIVTAASDGDHNLSRQPLTEWTWLGRARWEQLSIVGLITVGTVLRVYALGAQSLWFDEAITVNAAMAVLENGRPVFQSGATYWRAFPHTLVVSASMAVFGTAEWAARLPSVLFGAGTILVTYWLGREASGPRVGLLAAGLLTFATWEIAWSRQARMYQLFQLLYGLVILLVLRADTQENRYIRRLGALVVVIGLAAATHPIGYILLPVTVAYLSVTALVDGQLTVRSASSVVGVALVLTILFELVGPGITGALETVTATDVDYWDTYVSWGIDEFHAFFYLAAVGAIITVYTRVRRAGFLYVLAVVPPALIIIFSTQLFATRYLYFALPFLVIWAAIAVVYAATQVSSLWPSVPLSGISTQRVRSLVSILLIGSLMIGGGFTIAPQQEYQLGINAPQPEFAGAYEYVNQNRAPDDVIITGWTAPGVYYAGGVDYWLAHDLTGTNSTYTISGRERYSGAEPIRSAEELTATINKSGEAWVVLDRATYLRQSEQTQRIISTELNVANRTSGIVVYTTRDE